MYGVTANSLKSGGSMPSAFQSIILPHRKRAIGVFTHVVSPGEFHMHILNDEKLLENLILEMQSSYGAAGDRSALTTYKVGAPCVVCYDVDRQWYRAVIKQIFDETVRVSFVDYGNEIIAPKNCVVAMKPEFFGPHAFAVKCALFGIDEPDRWAPEEIAIFTRLAERLDNKSLRLHVVRTVGTVHYVELDGILPNDGGGSSMGESCNINDMYSEEWSRVRWTEEQKRNRYPTPRPCSGVAALAERQTEAKGDQVNLEDRGYHSSSADRDVSPDLQRRFSTGVHVRTGSNVSATAVTTQGNSKIADRPNSVAEFNHGDGGRPLADSSIFNGDNNSANSTSDTRDEYNKGSNKIDRIASSSDQPAPVWVRGGSDIINSQTAPSSVTESTSASAAVAAPSVVYAEAFPETPMFNDRVGVYYSHVDRLPIFHLIKTEDSDHRDVMSIKLLQDFNNMASFVDQPKVGAPCCATFENQPYRAKILSIDTQQNRAHISYVDYGNEETKPFTDLKRLPKKYADEFPPAAVPAVMDGVKADAAIERQTTKFRELVETCETLVAVVKGFDEQRRLYAVDLIDESKQGASGDVAVTMGLKTVFDYADQYPPYPTFNGKTPIYVSFIEKLPEFYMVKREDMQRIEATTPVLSEEMNTWDDVATPVVGTPCCTKFDGSPFRAKIVSFEADRSTARVLYVDYGNEETKPVSELKRLPRKFVDNFYPAAVPASLFRCNEPDTSGELTRKFREIVGESETVMALVKRQKDDRFVVDLDEESVGNVLLTITSDE